MLIVSEILKDKEGQRYWVICHPEYSEESLSRKQKKTFSFQKYIFCHIPLNNIQFVIVRTFQFLYSIKFVCFY